MGTQPVRDYVALPGHPETAPDADASVFRFSRAARFGFNQSLTDQIVVNWMIAEHKSQGLFQTECKKLDEERFWLLGGYSGGYSGAALAKTRELFNAIQPTVVPGDDRKALSVR